MSEQSVSAYPKTPKNSRRFGERWTAKVDGGPPPSEVSEVDAG